MTSSNPNFGMSTNKRGNIRIVELLVGETFNVNSVQLANRKLKKTLVLKKNFMTAY